MPSLPDTAAESAGAWLLQKEDHAFTKLFDRPLTSANTADETYPSKHLLAARPDTGNTTWKTHLMQFELRGIKVCRLSRVDCFAPGLVVLDVVAEEVVISSEVQA